MKKKYEKPTMFREEFNISQSVALGCVDKSAGFYKSKCGIKIPEGDFKNEVLFTLGNGVCTVSPNNVKENDMLCYHIPSDANRYFGS